MTQHAQFSDVLALAQHVSRKPFTYNDSTHVYMLDGQRCRSITNVAKIPTDDYTVNQWRHRMAAIGFTADPTLLEEVAAHIDDSKFVESVVHRAIELGGANVKSRRGVQSHAATERHDLDQPLITEQQQRDAALWERTLDAYGLVMFPEYVERIVLYPDDLVAGRFDRYGSFRHQSDWLVDIDIKTGFNAVKYPHGTAVQLALHVGAPLVQSAWHYTDGGSMEVTTEWVPQPEHLRRDVAYVVHMPTDERADLGTLYEFTLTGEYAGQVAARAALFCRHFQLNSDHCKRIEPPIRPAPNAEPSNVVMLDPVRAQADLRARIDLLPDGHRELLRMAWDLNVHGSFHLSMTAEQMAAATALVDTVDPFAQVASTPERPPSDTPDEPAPWWEPTEGEPISADEVAALQATYESMPERARDQINAVALEATQHRVPFHMADSDSERRFWLMTACIKLAANDSLDDDSARYLAATTVHADWPFDRRLPTGAVVGLLGAEHAESFYDLAVALCNGELHVSGDRLIPND